ncbi:MAG: flavodoxin family protein [Oscillospiraceae bacterium]|jgi:multimeric flavodoxin WrbA|nr:flavodoxin family protein [Oscillospiraceae bacterium]
MYIIITASPNIGGLTDACGEAAYKGITDAGGEAEIIDISAENIKPCILCGNSELIFGNADKGWGSCFGKAVCSVKDIMAELQVKIRDAEGLILVSPVYFGQPSEHMQYFMDRFRRLEVFNDEKGSAAKNKVVDMIATAGGSGNGTATCLVEMETWCRHVSALPKDRIGVTQYNREPMLNEITAAATRMVKGEYWGTWLTKPE